MPKVADGTLRSYLKAAKWVQVAVCALPLGASFVSGKPQFLGPPLGPLNAQVLPFCLLIGGCIGILPWFFAGVREARWGAIGSFLIFVAATLSYAATMSSPIVVPIGIPSQHRSVTVTIGTERSQWANDNYSNKSDLEMLISGGHSEDDIRKMWTLSSIQSGRMKLLIEYVLLIAFLNFFIGSVSRTTQLDANIKAVNQRVRRTNKSLQGRRKSSASSSGDSQSSAPLESEKTQVEE